MHQPEKYQLIINYDNDCSLIFKHNFNSQGGTMNSMYDKNTFSRIMQLVTARWITEPVHVAVKLGIADLLSEGPKTIDELADMTDSYAPYLFRIIRALVSVGIFNQKKNDVVENTPLSECMKAKTMGPLVKFFLANWHNQAWDKLYESVRTGKNAFEMAHGMSAFQWLSDHPEDADIFQQSNEIKIRNISEQLLEVYDFSNFNSITDIGGGTGELLTAILLKYVHVKGIVADLSFNMHSAEINIKEKQCESRCKVYECDFFKEIPGGSDLYVLSNILHDWDDDACVRILTNCRKAMKKNSILLIIEMIIPDNNEPAVAKLLDLEVLVMGGGKERTIDEYGSLLKKPGFNINRIITIGENEKIIECVMM